MIEASGLTNQQIAERMGVAVETAWRWRTANTEPRLDALPKLAAVLGCQPRDLLPDAFQ